MNDCINALSFEIKSKDREMRSVIQEKDQELRDIINTKHHSTMEEQLNRQLQKLLEENTQLDKKLFEQNLNHKAQTEKVDNKFDQISEENKSLKE